jgi:3',5'-nucleoside bisphosphate phosphatase
MLLLAADLHVHTLLSPCASRDMTPVAVAAEAARKGIGMIAVCDHNCTGSIAAVLAAAAAITDGPFVVPGIEITTAEEAHVLGWFPTVEAADAACAEVTAGMLSGSPEGAASCLPLERTVSLIHRFGGLAVAAHVDRPSFSVPSQLGFLPSDVPFDGLEISAAGAARGRAAAFASHGMPLVSSSDAHFLAELGAGLTLLEVEQPGFDELGYALAGRLGRRCAIA